MNTNQPTADGAVALAPPRRRWQLKLEIGADDIETLQADFDGLRDDIFRRHVYESHGGGYSGRHSLSVTEDPTMDHDTYHRLLDAYRAAKLTESRGS